jgi:hypothetical protein
LSSATDDISPYLKAWNEAQRIKKTPSFPSPSHHSSNHYHFHHTLDSHHTLETPPTPSEGSTLEHARFPVVQSDGRQLVEVALQRVRHFVTQVDERREEAERRQLKEMHERRTTRCFERWRLHVREMNGVHLDTQVVVNGAAEGVDDVNAQNSVEERLVGGQRVLDAGERRLRGYGGLGGLAPRSNCEALVRRWRRWDVDDRCQHACRVAEGSQHVLEAGTLAAVEVPWRVAFDGAGDADEGGGDLADLAWTSSHGGKGAKFRQVKRRTRRGEMHTASPPAVRTQ